MRLVVEEIVREFELKIGDLIRSSYLCHGLSYSDSRESLSALVFLDPGIKVNTTEYRVQGKDALQSWAQNKIQVDTIQIHAGPSHKIILSFFDISTIGPDYIIETVNERVDNDNIILKYDLLGGKWYPTMFWIGNTSSGAGCILYTYRLYF